MDYNKEIRKLEEALGMDPIWPCGSCIRKDEEFCSNRRCLQTLEEMKRNADASGNTDI